MKRSRSSESQIMAILGQICLLMNCVVTIVSINSYRYKCYSRLAVWPHL
ncbi:hypothetical protein YPPY13_1212 [Yersinia pestis PY-13]|uniref:Uncharacterized protein n=1 Tax=Yersinia pestis TaxID=632 RepID=A0AAX2I1B9_YERPE|nr:hypothetical protein DJ40_3180 [Yersinia pseudotuberculosis]AJI89989.1 hypothetical protein CH59_880 [Yersinia pestis]AJJ00627.1 hypothetical protein BZ18_1792 [Yersinia pestis Pestoides F]AJJ66248.1 hypothetical protein BZ16_2655 [Yersinia pseudotuberculosis PB1/+]AJJ77041.1 hypothetical protein CH57_3218 [Yersinia pestis A1122]AJJ79967.1 hypothetical protein CH58_3127 [Yersinia pestis Antiqua]AJJ84883.1 hypothetical protein CH56_1091 [Yersinia pestis Angola]AJJ88325.1 hypothetical prote